MKSAIPSSQNVSLVKETDAVTQAKVYRECPLFRIGTQSNLPSVDDIIRKHVPHICT